MTFPIILRHSADTLVGSYIVSLRSHPSFQDRGPTTLCQKVSHVAYRCFAVINILLRSIPTGIVCLGKIRGGDFYTKLDGLVNFISLLVIPFFLFGMPFGYLPKVCYLRRFSHIGTESLPLRIANENFNDYVNAMARQSKCIEVLNRLDDFNDSVQLKNALNKSLSESDADWEGRIVVANVQLHTEALTLAAFFDSQSAIKRLLQMGIPGDAPIKRNRQDTETILHFVTRTSFRTVTCDVNTFAAANFNTHSSDNLTPMDFALLSQRKIWEFEIHQNCFDRIDQWFINRTTISLANKLIKKGALFQREHYVELCDEWDQLAALAPPS